MNRPWRPFAGDDDTTFICVHRAPDGIRTFVAASEQDNLQAHADAARSATLARFRGRSRTPEADARDASQQGLWSRTPTPEQHAAWARACNRVAAHRHLWTDSPMPSVTLRWLLPEDDDPLIDSRCWGCCRIDAPGRVTLALRADASPERTFSTSIHELAHALDAEVLRYGMPRAMAEARARHIEELLG